MNRGVPGYSATFDARSRLFSQEPGKNQLNLTMFQTIMSDKLETRGHLFLNEVFDALKLPRTREGQTVGWVWSPGKIVVFSVEDADKIDWTNGVVLKFNVDGDILDKVWPPTPKS